MSNSCMRTDNELTRIYNLYADTVYRLSYIIVKNSSEAEDVMQNTFVKFMKTTTEFQSDEHIKGWLIRVAKNESINLQRHWFKQKRTDFKHLTEASYTDNYDKGILEKVLSLNVKYSVPIYLFYYEGYSGEQISKILKIKPSTLRSQLTRGREKLKLILEEDCDETR